MYELYFILIVLGVSIALGYGAEYLYRVKVRKRIQKVIEKFNDDYLK